MKEFRKMRIVDINDDYIEFDNGKKITYNHDRDCCEQNYADFKQLDTIGRIYNFDEDLRFEEVNEFGFRFGDSKAMFFIPCYSEQNGYYSTDIEIYYDGKQVLHFDAMKIKY